MKIRYMTLRMTVEPETPTSNRYRVGIGWYDEPGAFISVPDLKRAFKSVKDAIRGELEAAISDDAANIILESDWDALKPITTFEELAKFPGVVIS